MPCFEVRRRIESRALQALALAAITPACSLTSLDALSEGSTETAQSSAQASSSSGSGGQGGGVAAGGAPSASSSATGAGGTGGEVIDGLIGHWPLNEGVGVTANDVSGSDNHGTLFNGPTWVSGVDGDGLGFAGGSDHMQVASVSGGSFPPSGTLSLWFNGDFVSGAETASRGIFDDWDTGRSHLFVRRAKDNPEMSIQVVLQDATTGYLYATGFDVTPGAWHHVAVVWNTINDTAAVYFDNQAQTGVISDMAWLPSDQDFRISNNFIGIVDEIRLYDRPLSPEEVNAIHAAVSTARASGARAP